MFRVRNILMGICANCGLSSSKGFGVAHLDSESIDNTHSFPFVLSNIIADHKSETVLIRRVTRFPFIC